MLKRKKYDYDLIVIGSGAGGSVGAHHAVSLGKKVAIFEDREIGGECPNIACVPTKALLHAASVYETVQNSTIYGTQSSKPSLDYKQVKKWKDLVVERTGVSHGEESFKKSGLHLIKARANFISNHEVEADGKTYSAAKFLIATGSSVFIPPIDGLKDTGYITFEQAIDFESAPESIFILGGGAIGCEFAQILSTFGTKVTLADTLPKLIAKEDSEASDLVQALFENRGIKVLTDINVTKVEKKGHKKVVHYSQGQENHTTEVEEILISTGKRPVLSFSPEKAGIKVDDGKLHLNSYLQTNVSHIYAAGDVAGPYLFTHTGYYQSYVAVNNAFSQKKIKTDYTIVPRCVFVKPEVASVGITEYQAKEQKIRVKVGITPIGILGRANTSNELDGFIKVITDQKERIIGAAIVAPHAGEMIHELALAVRLKVKASIIADMMHAYPTYSEGIKVACSNLENK